MAKVVFFEGRKDQSFDVEMVKTLFPEFEKRATLVPLGSKTKVHRIQAALREADRHARLNRKLYSVVDKDFDEERLPESHVGVLHWGVYEIENFLIDPKYICRIFQRRMTHEVAKLTERQIERNLKAIAQGLAGHMVEHLLRRHVRNIRSTKVRFSRATPAKLDAAERIYKTQVLNRLAADVLSPAKLKKTEVSLRRRVDKMLLTNEWKKEFSGYRVIQELLAKYVRPFSIEQFRDELVAEMRADGFRPPAMETVVMAILDD